MEKIVPGLNYENTSGSGCSYDKEAGLAEVLTSSNHNCRVYLVDGSSIVGSSTAPPSDFLSDRK